MYKPSFLERGKNTDNNRVWAVAAGGLAVGAVIGAGAVMGVQYVLRGFIGMSHGRVSFGHPYGAAFAPEDAAFPTAGKPDRTGETGAAGGAVDTVAAAGPTAAESQAVKSGPDERL